MERTAIPPDMPGHDPKAWAKWTARGESLRAAAERKFKRDRNARIRAGVLPHMKETYWPEVEVAEPVGLELDGLAAHDG